MTENVGAAESGATAPRGAQRGSLRQIIAQDARLEAGNNISWRSIFAGLVTFIALSVLFSLVGTAVGLGGTDLTAENPTEGVGTGLIIWTIFSLAVSLGVAGFIAGLTANKAGLIHGFLTWALGVIAIVVLAVSAVSSAFGALGNMLGAAGGAVSSASSAAAQAVSNINTDRIDVDAEGVSADVRQVLANSSIEQLHPDYLQAQVDDTLADLQVAAQRIIVDGEDSSVVAEDVRANVEDRIASITEQIDEDALAREIEANTNLTAAESRSAANNIVTSYEEGVQKAEETLNNLANNAQETFDQAVVVANDAMNNTAKYSLYTFCGLILAMIITALGGLLGARTGRSAEKI